MFPGGENTGPLRTEGKVRYNAQDTEIVGIIDADLIHLTTIASGTGGDLTETIFDTTTYADGAIIKLTNSTGSSRTITHCSIRGKLVARLSGKLGHIHDAFSDWERIALEGERLFELGNNYVVTAAQVRKLADYWWKFHRSRKHIYTIDVKGTWHWVCPGEVYTLQIGGVGEKEYIDSVCVCVDVQTTRGAQDLGQTTISFEELYQNWVFDSNALSRSIARGCPGGVKSFPYAVVASQYDPGAADYYCDGTADQVEIQAANDYLVGTYGGGTIHLRKGTYKTTAAISLGSNVILEGEGVASIIKKNGNYYGIAAVGDPTSHLSNISIRDLTVTRDTADTNDVGLARMYYVDSFMVTGVTFEAPYYYGIHVQYSSGTINLCLFNDCQYRDAMLVDSTVNVLGCTFTGGVTTNTAVRKCLYITTGISLVSNCVFRDLVNGMDMDCVHLYDADGSTIDGNTFCNIVGDYINTGAGVWGSAIEVSAATSNCKISNNRIEDCTTLWNSAGYAINIGSVNNVDNVIIGNHCVNNGNLIIRGNCESVTDPCINGQAGNTESNCTFARSADAYHSGTYSYRFTKTVAAGTDARNYFHDALSTTDLVGLVAGKSYTLYAWVYIPSASGILGTEIQVRIMDYASAAWEVTNVACANIYDAWQQVSVTRTIRAGATGAAVLLFAAAAAALNEYFFADECRLRPNGVGNSHNQNFVDSGTTTRVAANTWTL